MADTVFEKASDIIAGGFHELMDSISDSDWLSIPVLKQKARKFERYRDGVKDKVATWQGKMQLARRTLKELQSEVAELDEEIDQIYGDDDESNDKYAKPKEALLMQQEALLKQAEKSLELATNNFNAMTMVREQSEGMLNKIDQQVKVLEMKKDAAQAQEEAVETLDYGRELTQSSGVDDQFARVGKKFDERLEVSSVKLSQAQEALTSSVVSQAEMGELELRLAERKKRIAAKKAAETSTPAA